ncbi:MAG: hypothetical protein NZ739_08980 [Verrucomicrobiae bacterium]|nr:hypothetical protein [Verrucomicrobiae bacterium]MDW7980425.1 hypothetical protein [Verrucomicrobiales bacterium]
MRKGPAGTSLLRIIAVRRVQGTSGVSHYTYDGGMLRHDRDQGHARYSPTPRKGLLVEARTFRSCLLSKLQAEGFVLWTYTACERF